MALKRLSNLEGLREQKLVSKLALKMTKIASYESLHGTRGHIPEGPKESYKARYSLSLRLFPPIKLHPSETLPFGCRKEGVP